MEYNNFYDYLNWLAMKYDLSDFYNRTIFVCKCLGFLDCMFYQKGDTKNYMYLKDRVKAMIDNKHLRYKL